MKPCNTSPRQSRALTRRSFVAAAGAAGVALAGAGVLSAEASPYNEMTIDSPLAQGGAICCDGCDNRCTAVAYASGEGVGRAVATGANPFCEKGYSALRLARSPLRVTQPLALSGEAQAVVSWDEALAAVGAALADANGGQTMAIANASDPSKWYLQQLMEALGASAYYEADAHLSGARRSAVASVLGNGDVVCNPQAADLVVAVAASAVRGGTGAGPQALAQAKARGAHTVLIDSVNPNPALYDEWIAVRPGTEGALLTAVAKQVFDAGLYQRETARQMAGFAEWSAALAPFTRDWAAAETGATAAQIDSLAARIGVAGPATMFDISGLGALGHAFASAPHSARVAVALAAVVGALGAQGATGWCSDAAWGSEGLPAVATAARNSAYPAADSRGSVGEGLQQLTQGAYSVVILDDVELADLTALEPLQAKGVTLVALASTLTPTAAACNYVLPKAAFFEQDGLPGEALGPVASASIGTAVVPAAGEARTLKQICSDLAVAAHCDGAEVPDEKTVAAALLAPYGLTPTGLAGSGAVALPGAPAAPEAATVQLTSAALGETGCPGPCVWDYQAAPQPASAGTAWLMAGEGACAPATMAHDAAQPAPDVPTASLNPATAKALGIAEGEEVTLVSHEGSSLTVTAHLSSLVHPEAIWWDASANQGFPALLWDTARSTAGFGSAVLQDAPVTIQKAGA